MEKDNYPDYIEKIYDFRITAGQLPERIDVFLTRSIMNATRAKVRKSIENKLVTVNGKPAKPSRKIQPGDHVVCKMMKPPPIVLVPEDIPLDILFEDDSLMVVNKPPGMVTHPGFGNRYGTLVNAILYHVGLRKSIEIENVDDDDDERKPVFASDAVRPGVVHRLDKDTSGILVVSKNPAAHAKLADQFAERTTERFYYALAWGKFEKDKGTLEGDIGRSPRDRKLFAVVRKGGKHARTDYEVMKRYEYVSLLKLKLHTGRTHQIRVHLSNIHRPVLGDVDYGGNKIIFGGHNPQWKRKAAECLKKANRQMLHAKTLAFTHPETGERLTFSSELPNDIKEVFGILEQ